MAFDQIEVRIPNNRKEEDDFNVWCPFCGGLFGCPESIVTCGKCGAYVDDALLGSETTLYVVRRDRP